VLEFGSNPKSGFFVLVYTLLGANKMRDILEHLEALAEARHEKMVQPDGRLRCGCGKVFDPDKEGGTIEDNPYAMPVCGDCLHKVMSELENNKKLKKATSNEC